jgi:tRNA pseudouridine55 synthase
MEIQHQPELILAINKPLTWTSFDVVNRLKYFIKNNFPAHKNIKIGHAGTLDPLATGILIVCIGKATKKIEEIQSSVKEYTGTIFLGATTPSYDLETQVDKTFETNHVTEQMLHETAKTFLGVQMQTPPIFSAKKINGKRAYESAREGEKIEMRKAQVEIFEMQITSPTLPEIHFRVVCSKGTYIRSIAFDLGQKLNSGAHLTGLCRSRSGQFLLENALSIENAMKEITAYLSKF